MNNEFRIVKNMKQFILSLDSFLSYRKVHEKRVFLKLICGYSMKMSHFLISLFSKNVSIQLINLRKRSVVIQ